MHKPSISAFLQIVPSSETKSSKREENLHTTYIFKKSKEFLKKKEYYIKSPTEADVNCFTSKWIYGISYTVALKVVKIKYSHHCQGVDARPRQRHWLKK